MIELEDPNPHTVVSMKRIYSLLILFALAAIHDARAGAPVASGKNPISQPVAEPEEFGRITLGSKFSSDLSHGYLDIVQGLHVEQDSALFLSLRGSLDDHDQQELSSGLAFRTLLENPNVILGANVFYDYINSRADNDFNQLGLGAELLSEWVDARFNYYLPESGRKQTGEIVSSSSSTRLGGKYRSGGFIKRDLLRDTSTTVTRTFEEGLQGWNAEVGFLVPGVNKYFDLRLFAGAYGYDNTGGSDYNGFKARVEARVSRHITLDVEYWDDTALVGGHWVGGVRFTSAFDLGELIQGRNPFKETQPSTPTKLRNRLDEQIIRSHLIMTGGSSPQPSDSSTTTTTTNEGVGQQSQIPAPPPPETNKNPKP